MEHIRPLAFLAAKRFCQLPQRILIVGLATLAQIGNEFG